jgi:hypothetical protein
VTTGSKAQNTTILVENEIGLVAQDLSSLVYWFSNLLKGQYPSAKAVFSTKGHAKSTKLSDKSTISDFLKLQADTQNK